MVEIMIGEKFSLRPSRADVAPSAQEWKTVLGYLPDKYKPTTQILPRDYPYQMRNYLEAEWDFQKRLL